MRNTILRAAALLIACLGILAPAAHTQTVVFPDAPLQTSSTISVKPNLLFVLDDSGSMMFQYTPDLVSGDDHWNTGGREERQCYDAADIDDSTTNSERRNNNGLDPEGNILGFNKICQAGDVPFMAPFFNTQYYNPAIRYRPGVNADGTSKTSQDASATSNWTSVRTDVYNVWNNKLEGGSATNVNLTQFPERVWCTAKGDAATDTAKCYANTTTYAYPDGYNKYGRDADQNIKYRFGQPYYWTIPTFEHCTDAGMTNCVVSATPVTIGANAYTVPSSLRYCKYLGSRHTMENNNLSLTDCQAKYDVDRGYTYPRFLGRMNPAETGQVAYARISFPSVPTTGQDITSVTVNGVNIMSGSPLTNFTTRAAAITALVNSINNKVAATGEQEFRACNGSGCAGTSVLNFTGGANDVYIYPTTAPGGSTIYLGAELNGVLPVVNGSPPSAGAKARATITISPLGSTGMPQVGGLTSISAGSNVLTSNFVVNPAATADQMATALAAAINTGPSSGLYQATAAGAAVVLERDLPGSSYNGEAITYTGLTRNATATFTVATMGGSGNKTVTVSIGSNASCSTGAVIWNKVVVAGTNEGTMANAIRDRINGQPQGGITASSNSANVTLTGQGSNRNGWYVCFDIQVAGGSSWTMPADGATRFSTAGVSPMVMTTPTMTGGQNTGPIPTTVTAFQNGLTNRPVPYRTDQATWVRVNLISGNTYPKSSARTDCAGTSSCTYEEEMTNFANWYSYYRTRMQTMKSAAGRSFSTLSDNFRVGFTAINDTTGTNFIKIRDFNASQKTTWYNKFYAMGNNGGTPLRQALSRAGRIFAGKDPFSTAGRFEDPVQYSCQQNFTILTTDGYWNENSETAIKRVDGTRVDNVDGAAGVAAPFFDGGPGSCPSSASGACLGNTCHGDTTDQGKFSNCNTLADVALYYATTDLRQSATGFENCTNQTTSTIANLCVNNVRETTRDSARFQHMTTFTLGLGVDGTLAFQDDYETAGSGDYSLIRAGTLKWPQVKNLHPTAVDDLWHAAVNGRGKYFSAKNPESLSAGLNGALAEVNAQGGAGAAAATSNLEPITGDNFAYVASYTTVKWTGNVEARTINLSNGSVSTTAVWCAEDVIDPVTNNVTCNGTMESLVQSGTDTRTIHMFSPTETTKLLPFLYQNMTAAQKLLFAPTGLSQYASLDSASQAIATGENLVNYLRGQYQYENRSANTLKAFRFREKTLADVIGSQPIYVKKPPFSYNDTGYAAYVTSQSGRSGTVYIGANDGMLHAFDATTGVERWAYVPTAMLPRMKQLADYTYPTNHRFFVDGSPKVGDVFYGGAWRTILVGGFSVGGVGYYALDITNPAAPLGLWEFPPATESDAGYSYSAPIITKLTDGTWVVIVSSGYNNSGAGYMYVLNAVTGAIIRKISTGTGSPSVPSGLGRLTGFAPEMPFNNTTKLVYGGDLGGNVWRFDPAVNNSAAKIATLKDSGGVPQPITTKVEVAFVDNQTLLYVGTGKYLETSDLSSAQTQTFYGIRDTYDTNGTMTDPRATLSQVTIVQTPRENGGVTRSSAASAANIVTGRGWYADLPVSGERLNVDPQFVNGTLVVLTNVPSNTACTAGGSSYINFFNYKGGTVLPGSADFTTAIVVGFVTVKVGDSFIPLITLSDSPNPVPGTAVPNDSGDTRYRGRRVSWKELNVD